jgi:hypothetical protein
MASAIKSTTCNARSISTPRALARIVLRVADLERAIEALKRAGVRFRNQMESGPGGRQIQLEDPDGNPIELFEPSYSRMYAGYVARAAEVVVSTWQGSARAADASASR